MPEVKAICIQKVKDTRRVTHDLFEKQSPGISRVYLDNINAARKFTNGDTSLESTGLTPEQYLTGLGSEIGMTATQFAAYIISENARLAAPNQTPPSVYDVELNYLKSSTQITMATTSDQVISVVNTYQTLCSTVTGN